MTTIELVLLAAIMTPLIAILWIIAISLAIRVLKDW